MMRKMNYWVGSIFWMMTGVYVAFHAYQLGLGRLKHPGPGFVFFLAGSLLIILSAIDLVGTFIGKSKTGKDEAEISIWSGIRWKKLLLLLGGLSAYAYFFERVGFFISTFLLMVLLFKGIEPTKWWIAVMSSLITMLLSYVIFNVWLGVPYPKGFLDF